jgi:hypothetical protein
MTFLKRIFSLPALTLLVALTLSTIAAWYSILGLTAIFAAAVIPIIIMGGALEVAKVVATVWLHRYWDRAGWTLKLYLVPAVMALALLTSMGIFGFLSKAHIDQGVPVGDQAAQVALLDEKIANERQNIDAARSLLKQMDDAVIGITASKDKEIKQRDGSVFSQSGAERAVAVRKSQAKERADLTKQIEEAQARIVKIQEEKAPISAQLRKVEAEVGPIKYVAAMIYGDNPDANTLERAVRWMIILIVFVFDPLALTMVIAAQHSFRWMREDEEKKDDEIVPSPAPTPEPVIEPAVQENVAEESDDKLDPCYKCGTTLIDAPGIGPFCPNKECDVIDGPFIEDEPTQSMKFDDPGEHPADTFEPNEEITIERIDDEQPLPTDNEPAVVENDAVVGTDVLETLVVDTNAVDGELEPVEDAVVEEPKPTKPAPIIRTEGVTLNETGGGYIEFEGKSVSRQALEAMHPEFFALTADSTNQISTNFGTIFPKIAKKGDVFVRVDMLPNRVYKFDSNKWIEINKEQSDSYLYDEEYIKFLIQKIDGGEYDVELLSDNERAQIEEYLRNQNT